MQRAARSGADEGRYTLEDLDIAILRVGNDFVSRTGCTLQVDIVDIVADAFEVDFSELIADGFRPEMLNEIRLDESADYAASVIPDSLDIVSLREVRNKRARDQSTGVPCKIGFLDWSEAELWKTPRDDGTLSVWWRPPFTSLTPGDAAGDTLLNIPADLIYPVLDAAAVILQIHEPEKINAALRTGFYNDHVLRSAGAGGLGEKSASTDDEE